MPKLLGTKFTIRSVEEENQYEVEVAEAGGALQTSLPTQFAPIDQIVDEIVSRMRLDNSQGTAGE